MKCTNWTFRTALYIQKGYTDSGATEREYYCHSQDVHMVADTKKVWAHSKSKSETKGRTGHHGTRDACVTHQPSPRREGSPWASSAYEIQPLFPDFGAVFGEEWIDPCRGLRQCLGELWLPLRGIHSRRCHTKGAQGASRPFQCQTQPLAHRSPQILPALLIPALLLQPG